MKRRHQRKYADNPNPNRAAQQNKRQASSNQPAELADGVINLHQLALLFMEVNHGVAPNDADVWEVMMQCNPDQTGRIKVRWGPCKLNAE